MVGTVRAPAVLPVTFPSPKSSLAQHQLLLFRWQLQVPKNNIFSRYRSRKEQYDLTVRANGYTRIPLETAGAYRLIDEQTGENFIVWGGDDDGEAQVDNSNISNLSFPLPPPPPPPPPSKLKRQQQPTSPPFGKSILSSKSSSNLGAFGKLKAQRVRALLTKTTNNGNMSSSSNRSSSRAEKSKKNTDNNDDIVVNDTHVRSRLKDALVDTQDSNFLRTIAKHSPPPPPPPPPPPNSVRTPTQYRPPSRGWGAPPSDTTSDTLDYPKQKRQYRKSNQDSGFFSRKSFNELGCTDDMIKALSSLQFIRPSNIQAMSYATVLQGKSCIIADQSGSGKTLAYLCPIIQGLRQQELMGLGKSAPKNPRVVVLVPTAELASQVLNNCRSLSRYGVPFRSMVATGGFRQKTQLENLQQELDVLIVTPGRFIYLLNEGFLELSSLRSVVLDEVDILFGDEEFEEVLKSLINSAPMATQYLFATATLPVEIYNKLVQVFPDCEVIMGPGMHRTSSGLEEVLVDCSGDGEEKSPDTAFLNKKTALLQLVQESPVPKTIVFCNKIETCRKVENILKRIDKKEHQIRALPFHSALEQESRLSNMKEFLSSKPDELLFLICTDRASRGIDFNVDHVILFDFPRDPSEYVRRVGRTARGAGGKGRAFVFAVGKQVSLARKIIQRNQKGHPLHDVPSAYELERSSSS